MPAQAAEGARVFDPAALIDHDEKVEPTFELDIPRLPGDEEKPASPASDDFQMDLDSDIIRLFNVGEVEAVAEPGDELRRRRGGGGRKARFRNDKAGPCRRDARDACRCDGALRAGRAGIHRFRRSRDRRLMMISARQPCPRLRRATTARWPKSSSVRRSRAPRGPRWQTIGVGVAAIVLVGAVAVLGWDFMQPDAGSSGDGGPRIIAASKEPVKQKPANPGGKAVPNQNKIVYDKVDGSRSDGLEQKSLVSSTETPVDVVQRTLQAEQPRARRYGER